jgi:hypothetical protein
MGGFSIYVKPAKDYSLGESFIIDFILPSIISCPPSIISDQRVITSSEAFTFTKKYCLASSGII